MTRPSQPQRQPAQPATVALDADHPGFRDPVYRARRNEIARAALLHVRGQPAPRIAYTAEEDDVWRTVWRDLAPLHRDLACRRLNEAQRDLALDRERVPQLEDWNPVLEQATGFRMEPVAGLIAAADFLTALGDSVFLSTQYMRHHSRPHYTPEPDLVHEMVGHAASLTVPELAELSEAFGRTSARATAKDDDATALERVYWFTLEFGAVRERGRPRALGAGLLSSVAEIQHLASGAVLRPWDLEAMAATAYDPTDLQPQLFVAPSYRAFVRDLERWLAKLAGA